VQSLLVEITLLAPMAITKFLLKLYLLFFSDRKTQRDYGYRKIYPTETESY
jgi:hypothetical protein